jgi:hypothetical protein
MIKDFLELPVYSEMALNYASTGPSRVLNMTKTNKVRFSVHRMKDGRPRLGSVVTKAFSTWCPLEPFKEIFWVGDAYVYF